MTGNKHRFARLMTLGLVQLVALGSAPAVSADIGEGATPEESAWRRVDAEYLGSMLTPHGWRVERDREGGLLLFPNGRADAPTVTAGEDLNKRNDFAAAAGQASATQGVPVDVTVMRGMLEPHGWRVERDTDGGLLLFPGGDFAPTAAEPSSAEPLAVVPAAGTRPAGQEWIPVDVDLLRSRLAPHGWRVERDRDGGLLLFPGAGTATIEHAATPPRDRLAIVPAALSRPRGQGWIPVELDFLSSRLAPHGWRLERAADGSLLLFPSGALAANMPRPVGPTVRGPSNVPPEQGIADGAITEGMLTQAPSQVAELGHDTASVEERSAPRETDTVPLRNELERLEGVLRAQSETLEATLAQVKHQLLEHEELLANVRQSLKETHRTKRLEKTTERRLLIHSLATDELNKANAFGQILSSGSPELEANLAANPTEASQLVGKRTVATTAVLKSITGRHAAAGQRTPLPGGCAVKKALHRATAITQNQATETAAPETNLLSEVDERTPVRPRLGAIALGLSTGEALGRQPEVYEAAVNIDEANDILAQLRQHLQP